MTDAVRYMVLHDELTESLSSLAPDFHQAAKSWKDGDPPHIWLFDLRQVLDTTLTNRQAERIASRTVLSALITAYAPWMQPAEYSNNPGFDYVTRPGGKPKAVSSNGKTNFQSFNISHSAGLLAIAIAPCESNTREVGVDMETRTPKSNLSRDELREWVHKEAAWKCIGVGMTAAVDAPDVVNALRNVKVEELTPTFEISDKDNSPPSFELALAWNW